MSLQPIEFVPELTSGHRVIFYKQSREQSQQLATDSHSTDRQFLEWADGAHSCALVDNTFHYLLPDKLTEVTLSLSCRRFIHRYRSQVGQYLTVVLPEGDWAMAAAQGLALGLYSSGLYKTNRSAVEPLRVWVQDADLKMLRQGLSLAEALAMAMDLVNDAPNRLTPSVLAGALIGLKNPYCQAFSLTGSAIEQAGLYGFWAVAKGSSEPPEFAVLDYHPPDACTTIALIGKGVTFDSGGISLKERANLHWLKSDMGGAAAVIGATRFAIENRLPFRLITVVPACENMPGSGCFRPGDVIATHSGKTVEIEDTDAEGRILLADAISWLLAHYQPDTIIDVATLTGSVVHALGYQAGGLFCQNDELADSLLASGQASGEKLWRLPLWDEYATALESDIADLKNFGGLPAGGCTAAKFIQAFTQNHPRWAHIDMAGVAYTAHEFTKSRSATGYGTGLLAHWLMNWAI